MMVVDENEGATAYAPLEDLKELAQNLGATVQNAPVGTTDIVVLGDIDREKDTFAESGKGKALQDQIDKGSDRKAERKIKLCLFKDFMRITGLEKDIRECASIAAFEKGSKTYVEPGPERTRGKCFPRTLVKGGGEKGAAKGLFADYF